MSRVFSGSSKFKSCPGSGNLLSIHCCLSESWLEEWNSGLRWAPCFLNLRPFFGGFFTISLIKSSQSLAFAKFIQPFLVVSLRLESKNTTEVARVAIFFTSCLAVERSVALVKKPQNLIDIGFSPTIRALLFPSFLSATIFSFSGSDVCS